METLDAVNVADSFPLAGGGAQMGPVYQSNGGYFSVSEPVYVEYAYGGYGTLFWTQEVPLPAGPVILEPGTVGVRLRNYTAGLVAVASGALSERSEPSVTITSAGVATPGTGVLNVITPVFNVTDPQFGAKGDGATDDTAAIQAAINAASSSGVVWFPFAVNGYLVAGQLSLDNSRNVTLMGASNWRGSPVQLILSGGGAGSLISARSSAGLELVNLGIQATNAAFTGFMIDFSSLPAALLTEMNTIHNCRLSVLSTTATTVRMSAGGLGSISIVFERVWFNGGGVAIKGLTTNGDLSNTISVRDCFFDGFTSVPIQNPGADWLIQNCSFEPLASGTAGAVSCAGTVGLTPQNLRLDGVFCGDATAGAGTWVTVGGGLNVTVRDSLLSSPAGGTGIKLTGQVQGLVVSNNQFTSLSVGVDYGAFTHLAVVEEGSVFNTVTTPRTVQWSTVGGQVSSAGAITGGSGFTVVRNGVGDYSITFSPAYRAAPVVTVTNTDTTQAWIQPVYSSAPAAAGFRVLLRDTTNTSRDGAWQFQAFLLV